MAQAEWHLDPATAGRHLSDLVAAGADGRLAPQWAPVAVSQLAWQGRVDDAVATLEHTVSRAADAGPEVTAALRRAGHYVSYLFPGTTLPSPDGHEPGRSDPNDPPSPFAMVREVLSGAHGQATVADSELGLQRSHDVNARTEATVAWLETLLYADSLDRAEHWSSVVLAQVSRWHAPATQAVVAAIRAEVAFRRGDLDTAASLSRAALDNLSPKGWGVTIGGPLSTLVLSATAMGRYDEAAALLLTPTPAAMMRTPFGVRYLYARGRYNMATDRLPEAFADFRTCGELMQSWNMDQPTLAPWRTDGALTLLHMGRPCQARELAEEELRRSTDQRTRSRALLLRALAMTGNTERCVELLVEASEIFEECGDRLELAYTLTSLGMVLRGIGDPAQARLVLHRADRMARECGAEVVRRRVVPHRHRTAPAMAPTTTPDEASRLVELSQAERRVAVLAARGMTNREISARLYITTSTVEQHLTRIYRKLSITRRADLPRELAAALAHSA
jgi:DNA-binding CsgD family transcriptional regulator